MVFLNFQQVYYFPLCQFHTICVLIQPEPAIPAPTRGDPLGQMAFLPVPLNLVPTFPLSFPPVSEMQLIRRAAEVTGSSLHAAYTASGSGGTSQGLERNKWHFAESPQTLQIFGTGTIPPNGPVKSRQTEARPSHMSSAGQQLPTYFE